MTTVFAVSAGEQIAVDVADTADQPVGRCVRDQVGDVAATALGCDHRRSVFDERVGVDQVREVLAGGALALSVTLLDRCAPSCIEPGLVTGDDFGEIRRTAAGRTVRLPAVGTPRRG